MKNKLFFYSFIIIFSPVFLSTLLSCTKSEKNKSITQLVPNAPVLIEKASIAEVVPQSFKAPLVKSSDDSGFSVGMEFTVEVEEGGLARFVESDDRFYIAEATSFEGWDFDYWVIYSGAAESSLYDSRLTLSADNSGIRVKAFFISTMTTLYVSSDALRGDGQRRSPFSSISDALALAEKRLSSGVESVEVRVSKGVYSLGRREVLVCLPGIQIMGGYDSKSWQREEALSRDLFAEDLFLDMGKDDFNLTYISVPSNFTGESVFYLSTRDERGEFSDGEESVVISQVFVESGLSPEILISSVGVNVDIEYCAFKSRGKSIFSGFNCGLNLVDSLLVVNGTDSEVVLIKPASVKGVLIANSHFMIGSIHSNVEDAIAIDIFSLVSDDSSRVRISGNWIEAYVEDDFQGIKVENGLLICEKNRIESSVLSESSRGIELRGEAVVNRNRILLNSERGFGLSYKGESFSGRILNNTIVASSVLDSGKMTACGRIDGQDLLVSNNVFVNPVGEKAAALGVDYFSASNKIYNNRVVSSNAEEKKWVIGHNGNIDSLPDKITGASISDDGVEVEPLY